MNSKKRKLEYFIVRWSDNIRFPDGRKSNMACLRGSKEEVKRHAEAVAEKNGTTVEAII